MQFGKKHKNKDKQDVWTNYECAIFTSNQNQIDFYRNTLVAGTVVVVKSKHEEIDIQQGNDGKQYPKIKLIHCEIEDVYSAQPAQAQAPQQQPQQQAPQGGYQQAPQQAAPQQNYNQPPPAQQQPQRAPQQAPAQAPQQAPQQTAPQSSAPQPAKSTGFDDFDDDIPFN